MDLSALVVAVIGSSGVAGALAALGNWVGLASAVRKSQALVDLHVSLAKFDGLAANAVAEAAREESLRAAARVKARHGLGTLVMVMVFLAAGIYLAPLLAPQVAAGGPLAASVRVVLFGLSAAFGAYAGLELLVRRDRAALIRGWRTESEPLDGPGHNPPGRVTKRPCVRKRNRVRKRAERSEVRGD